jgi:hypothetical protein
MKDEIDISECNNLEEVKKYMNNYIFEYNYERPQWNRKKNDSCSMQESFTKFKKLGVFYFHYTLIGVVQIGGVLYFGHIFFAVVNIDLLYSAYSQLTISMKIELDFKLIPLTLSI